MTTTIAGWRRGTDVPQPEPPLCGSILEFMARALPAVKWRGIESRLALEEDEGSCEDSAEGRPDPTGGTALV